MSDKRNEQLLKELKKANLLTTVAFALAVIFMGLQFWPAQYTYGMRLSLAAIFILAGFWLLFWKVMATDKVGRASNILKWMFTAVVGAVIILAIILYIVSVF